MKSYPTTCVSPARTNVCEVMGRSVPEARGQGGPDAVPMAGSPRAFLRGERRRGGAVARGRLRSRSSSTSIDCQKQCITCREPRRDYTPRVRYGRHLDLFGRRSEELNSAWDRFLAELVQNLRSASRARTWRRSARNVVLKRADVVKPRVWRTATALCSLFGSGLQAPGRSQQALRLWPSV